MYIAKKSTSTSAFEQNTFDPNVGANCRLTSADVDSLAVRRNIDIFSGLERKRWPEREGAIKDTYKRRACGAHPLTKPPRAAAGTASTMPSTESVRV